MFGHKTETPHDNWLGLVQYNCRESISEDALGQQQYELIQAKNKLALRSIWQSMEKNKERLNQNSLLIP